jgi:hypothetical protein
LQRNVAPINTLELVASRIPSGNWRSSELRSVEMTASDVLLSPSRPRGRTGNVEKRWVRNETQTRCSEAVQLPDLHRRTRPLIRRFGVRVPGGPRVFLTNFCALTDFWSPDRCFVRTNANESESTDAISISQRTNRRVDAFQLLPEPRRPSGSGTPQRAPARCRSRTRRRRTARPSGAG